MQLSSVRALQYARLIELVRQFCNLRVLVIGDVMLDTYLEGTATRLCSEGPIPVVAKTAEYHLPGGAANTAANLRALKANVALLGVTGTDSAGSLLRTILRAHNVGDTWLIADSALSTLHKLRILADGQYVVRFDEGWTREQLPATINTYQHILLDALDELYHWCDLVVVSDYGYGVTSNQLIARLQVLLAQQRKMIVLDSKALHYFRHLPATTATPNYMEASAFVDQYCGTSYHLSVPQTLTDEKLAHLGNHLLALLNTEFVTMTLGFQGVVLFSREQEVVRLPAHFVANASDVGAGDSFLSAMALALAAGGNPEDAARIGIDAASIAVSRPRTAIVRYQELLQRVCMYKYAAVPPLSSSATSEDGRPDIPSHYDEHQEVRYD